jgi:hypothetical protein
MHVRSTLLGLSLVGFALGVPAQDFKLSKAGPEVKVDADPEVDFTAYNTFGWSEIQEPAPNPVNHIRITRAVERELQSKGLKPSGNQPPDLRIHYFGYVEKRLKGTSRQQENYQPTADVKTVVDFSRVKEGTLILEFFSRTTGRLLWRGVAMEPVAPPDETEAQINRMVKALVERFPPKS